MSTSSKLKQQFVRPIVVGLVSALGARAMSVSYKVDLPLLGEVPKEVFYGVVGFGSSLATETLHQWVLPYLPQSAAAVKAENALLSPVLHAGVNFAVLRVLYPGILKEIGWQEPVMLGIGSELVGGYSFDNFIRGMDWMR